VAEAGSEPPPERRDPFWPVGYVPRRKQPATVAERPVEQPPPASAWEEARKHLDFRGSTRIGQERNSAAEKYLAIVNGKVVEAGDIVSTLYEGRLYRWRIEAIGPHGITLAKLDVRTP
jgi:hypothetical protein